MSLPNSIREDVRRLIKDVDDLSLWLTELKRLQPPTDERVVHLYSNARLKIIDMRADVNGILASVQADGLTGQASAQVPTPAHLQPVTPEVEGERVRRYNPSFKRPAPRQVPTAALLASLHRVADHTMDAEEMTALAEQAPHQGGAA